MASAVEAGGKDSRRAAAGGGCAEWNYTETNHTPESRYDTYYGPDYYPYYPYYAYYGGAYYYGY